MPDMVGPHTEIFGLIDPGRWIDFFRYIGEAYEGIITPEFDNRNIRENIMKKMMKADRDYDVVFQPKHVPPPVGDFDDNDTKIPESKAAYYLRADTGPRWIAAGVLSRPFITTAQNDGKFAMTSLESSDHYGASPLSRFMTFKVDHCLTVIEGVLEISMQGGEKYLIHEGETAFIANGQGFALGFASRYVRVWTFSSGNGIESVIHEAGELFEGVVLPDEAKQFDQSRLDKACEKLGVQLG